MRRLFSAPILLVASALVGCPSATPPPNIEDIPRRIAPLPACIMYLPPTKNAKQGFIRQLHEDEYWKLVFPGFDQKDSQLSSNATDCTGRAILSDWCFKNGQPIHSNWPEKVEEGDVVYGGGGDRLKV